ncbi:MAG: YqgE/AlgH family protein [Actinomycetota bacterium]|nr:YqgE/AlgH family protein [Actinomycetota bacterium]
MISTKARLLVATPELLDPNFFRTVVLMLEHNDEGAMGLVLNRTYDAQADEVVPYWANHLKPPRTLHCGGPVSEESVVGLGKIPNSDLEGAAPLVGAIGVLDLYRQPDELPGVGSVRLFSGYAGWDPGQLDAECEVGGWMVIEPEPEDLLTDDPGGLWRRVLARQPGMVALLAEYPDDPASN